MNSLNPDARVADAFQEGNMMLDWQTPLGPSRRMVLNTKKPTLLGTWNVRTMYQAGKAHVVAKEMKSYNIHILGLSETRWIGTGETRLTSGAKILYSGHQAPDAAHTQGVAFMLSLEAQRSLISWEPHGPRIIEAFFKTSYKNIKVRTIMCYAPTNEAEDVNKEEFYDKLSCILEKKHSSKDITILMGDMNAKVGQANDGYTQIMGTHGEGVMNENGEMFADFCLDHNLVIGGTIFPHKPVHKLTWTSPDNRTQNQIDHICINGKFRRSLLDVRVKRGADVNSDHHLVIAKLQIKLKNIPVEKSLRVKYDLGKLKDRKTLSEFKIKLSNRFEILGDASTVEDEWKQIKDTYNNTCKEVLGLKKSSNKDWISAHSWELIQKRKLIKESLITNVHNQDSYKEANKLVKKSIRKDKRDYINNLAAEAEIAAKKNNTKEVYDITRKLTGNKTNSSTQIRNTAGELLTSFEEQQERWVEHFSNLLNRPPPDTEAEIPPPSEELDIDCNSPTTQEIAKAILALKNHKAAGPDNIPAEALKNSMPTSTSVLKNLIDKIWEDETFPEDWRDGHIVVLPKKGDLTKCDNNRGIMLTSVPGKVLSKIILTRIKDEVDPKLRKNQAGFRAGRSCADQIAALRIIIEQSLEFNASLYINFIDYQKAFDSLDRNTMWKILAHYGIPPKIIEIIKKMYSNQKAKILFKGKLSLPFLIMTGVRQGCLLSPFLFLLAIDYIMKNSTLGRSGLQWTLTEQLDDLDFANDLAIISNTHRQMQAIKPTGFSKSPVL